MFLLCREDGDGAGLTEDDAIPPVSAAHLFGLAGRDVGVGLLARRLSSITTGSPTSSRSSDTGFFCSDLPESPLAS